MEDSYLRKVLRAGYITTFSAETQSDLRKKLPSPRLQLQQRIQDHLPFSTLPLDNQNEIEAVAEEILFEELFGDTSPLVKPERMDEQQAEQKFESDRHLPKPTPNTNSEIKAVSFTQDNPLPVRKYADVNWHGTTESNMDMADVKSEEKEVQEDASGVQETEDKIDTQNPEIKNVPAKESDRIPPVKAIKEYAIRVPRANRFNPSSYQALNVDNPEQQHQQASPEQQHWPEPLGPRTKRIAETPREQQRAPRADQESVHRPSVLVQAREAVQRPANRQNLNGHFFTQSLQKTETQMAKITKDVALINQKLDKHKSDEQRKPATAKFLPKRPVSHNLGGWSNLARRYIR